MCRLAGLAGIFVWLLLAGAAAAQGPTPPAGPPYPQPTDGVFVYDYANILSPAAEAAATRTIVAIRERTAAQAAVYTQFKPGATTDSTRLDANALIDQWGIGRRGFDDGVVILFNMSEPCHGQVQLYAGPGFEAAFLSNDERQSIYEDDMLPLLKRCDMDGALNVAMSKIDAAATPEHAQQLQLARQLNAVVGLVGAPIIFLLAVGWAGRSWLRYGKDPVYLDDPSILMPAPPPALTAASGAVIWEGKATRRAWTVGLLDLASRGEFNFQPEQHFLAKKVGIQLLAAPPDDPYVVRNRRRPLSEAENLLLVRVQGVGPSTPGGLIESSDLQKLAPAIAEYTKKIEQHVADSGWYREPPAKATRRLSVIGWVELFGGVAMALWLADAIPMSALTLLGGAFVAAGIITLIVAQYMPARTMSGAMIYAMLAAYRRTLQKTMAMSVSMVQVVEQANIAWLETPDQAVVWGVALGLNDDVQQVLERSAEEATRGATSGVWLPAWYGGYGYGSVGGGATAGGFAPGLFSSGGVPDFGGMMSALGTVGGSSSSSGSGGFGGGGGGGGGGGAGGGF